jgi:hypothetical protein
VHRHPPTVKPARGSPLEAVRRPLDVAPQPSCRLAAAGRQLLLAPAASASQIAHAPSVGPGPSAPCGARHHQPSWPGGEQWAITLAWQLVRSVGHSTLRPAGQPARHQLPHSLATQPTAHPSHSTHESVVLVVSCARVGARRSHTALEAPAPLLIGPLRRVVPRTPRQQRGATRRGRRVQGRLVGMPHKESGRTRVSRA